ncbi:helicase-related protein [Planktothrix mougeotii]|uniref:DUF3883 domain-containing protein n=1 Tax=Planktothrix mougeotii LEGE 06226 TaxID=1828728 RepID=A0ABR9UI72_9CYAN|nr:helicase-related protein [Planktothrix mougeotii]MBE9146143.1 DUF3883 domain-containing protein [Planktothrix mougeotii LEGE 06226]
MIDTIVGKRILIPTQFTGAVTIETADLIEDAVLLQVRTGSGELREAILTVTEVETLLSQQQSFSAQIVDANAFSLFIESTRIKTAFAFDPHFAVSLSGVRPLPHQLEAVYERILPQVRLRFLLADDPGAGKTIMTGLLIKELKLRGVIERILILTPAPLTTQWQDELKNKFAETYEVITSTLAKNQLAGNPWERFRQCIASIDFAKREDVIPGILQVDWDLVIIDEAHKCSARTQGDELRRTGRYKLAEELSKITERIILLTATPHQGDVSQFHNFLRLLDPEQFISNEINPDLLQLENSPWFLRRIKEELRDFNGQKLFKKRHAITVQFSLSAAEEFLYQQVTQYINRYLGKTKGGKQGAVALARTVLQRRLASSLNAILNSLKKRQHRFSDLLEELEQLPPQEQRQRLINLGKPVDNEVETDDCSEEELEDFAVELTLAEQLEQLREELRELKRLVKLAQDTINQGDERKLNELENCLKRSEFSELKDGRGKLLIFTEHRDTLEYLKRNLNQWGYSTCEIHGGMNVLQRKDAQKDFKSNKQICLATEAAGEGINLQFCRLMINYDIPWNPNRLEQRMGRIHRIGQEHEVYIFNFVAITTVEGRVLNKLLTKLEEIKNAMGDRVFDVIGQLLQVNEIRFEDLVREATYSQSNEDEAMETLDKLTPERLQTLEQATGLALATSHVDFSQICNTQTEDYRSEEQRLMPYYVEDFFQKACHYLRVNLEVRADGLWRIPYLKEEFRSEQLEAVRRLGTPDKNYSKLTFYKQHLELATDLNLEFISPGHCLFAALAERLDQQLQEQVGQQTAIFTDADTDSPYRIHFFKVQIEGQTSRGEPQILNARLYAMVEQLSGELGLIAADVLHDLSIVSPDFMPESGEILHPLTPRKQQELESWLKVKVQRGLMEESRSQRQRELQIRQDYLKQAMDRTISEAQRTQMRLAAKVAQGDETYRVARDSAQNKVRTLQERYKTKQTELEYLQIVRPGRVMYLGTALVYPTPPETLNTVLRTDPEVEALAMEFVMDYERQQGWQPEDVSDYHDGSGFDIRSIGPSPDGVQPPPVRRIEVKGRAQQGQGVSLTGNEWRKAQQLGESYWLYVVWGCHTPNPQLLRIPNPTQVLARDAKEIKQVTRYLVEGEALQKNALIE